jgi:hypothetical protein
MNALRSALFPLLALCALACSSGSTGGPTGPSSTGPKSLRADVLPVFQTSCTSNSTCHGSSDGIEVFLSGGDVHRRIVGVPSTELATMPYVTPGDPTNSYLMHKVDGTLADFHAHCAKQDCGLQMPKGEAPLSQADRDVIRAWIEQGALDN